MKRLATKTLRLVPVLLAVGCGGTTDPGCDLCTTSAIVYGQVRTVSGVPITGAQVTVEAHATNCAGRIFGATNLRPTTDADGRYRDQTLSFNTYIASCLIVNLTPPAGSGLSMASVAESSASIRFRPSYPAGGKLDSARVDVILANRNG